MGHLVGFVCLKDNSLCFVRAADANVLTPYLDGDGLWQSTDVQLLTRKATEVDSWLASMETERHFDLAAQGLQFAFRREPFYRNMATRIEQKQHKPSLSLEPAEPECQAAFQQVFDAVAAQVGGATTVQTLTHVLF